MESREEFLNEIREINPQYDLELIGKAYDVAVRMHEGQFRKSGDPYVTHPMEVAKILARLGMDDSTLVAGLLHDVVEDTEYTEEDLIREFGENIDVMVDGVTKLASLNFESKEERQVENYRKMFLAMSRDIRVLIIKLADRLHNLRTINYMNEKQIHDKCRETLDIYAPLASRLGIYTMKFELEDTAMKYLYPEEYRDISEKLNAKKQERQEALDHVISEIREALTDLNLEYEISGRSKHFYSIFRKMQVQQKTIDEIFDLMAVRIIVDTVKDCYAVLGVIHTMWTPIPGRFKDYIAMPKPNMYQSLHTTVLGDTGRPFEIQIRTHEMHQIAEYGIAAHWKYKEGITADKDEVKLSWLRQALEWQKETKDPEEFIERLKVDLFDSQVYVFTPAGDVLELPAGATPLDFAFKIHTDVGAKCIGARVNGRMVPIDHELQNGNIVEIMTSPNASGPSVDWLRIAKSPTAKTKIRQWLKKENRSDSVDRGRENLEKYLQKKGEDPGSLITNTRMAKLIKELGFGNLDELYTQLANGGALVGRTANTLIEYDRAAKEKERKKEESTIERMAGETQKPRRRAETASDGVIVRGMQGLLIRMSRCCSPVPGDDIVGYITKGRGISVHRVDCENIRALDEKERERLIEVEWNESRVGDFEVDVTVVTEDRKGVFSDLSKVCETSEAHILAVNTQRSREQDMTIVLTLSIHDTRQLRRLLRTLRGVRGVIRVYRTAN